MSVVGAELTLDRIAGVVRGEGLIVVAGVLERLAQRESEMKLVGARCVNSPLAAVDFGILSPHNTRPPGRFDDHFAMFQAGYTLTVLRASALFATAVLSACGGGAPGVTVQTGPTAVTAALSVKHGRSCDELDLGLVQAELVGQGVRLQ